MKQEYQLLYEEMMTQIAAIEELSICPAIKAEKCYWIAFHSWMKLKEVLKNYQFIDDEEEISFFRDMKPKFCLEMEYYVILTEALPFEPIDNNEAINFWTEERRRLGRFVEKHSEFIKYYKSGRACQDANFFLRRNCGAHQPLIISFYDYEPMYHTTHDRVVRSYLARFKYGFFITKKLQQLVKGVKEI